PTIWVPPFATLALLLKPNSVSLPPNRMLTPLSWPPWETTSVPATVEDEITPPEETISCPLPPTNVPMALPEDRMVSEPPLISLPLTRPPLDTIALPPLTVVKN